MQKGLFLIEFNNCSILKHIRNWNESIKSQEQGKALKNDLLPSEHTEISLYQMTGFCNKVFSQNKWHKNTHVVQINH